MSHPEIKIGSRVKYARSFLRSTGMFTGEVPFLRGTVIALESRSGECPDLATVQWCEGLSARVFITNLWPLDKGHLEPA